MKTKHKILLVNPFASAAYLSTEFKKYPTHTTALYTIELNKINNYLTPDIKYFDEQIFICSEDSQFIINKIGGGIF